MMKLFDTVNTETALFVSTDKARHMCKKAFNRWLNLREATYHRRYSRGAILGYWILLKFGDGTSMEMSEAHATELV